MSVKLPKIKSTFAILDVTRVRAALERLFRSKLDQPDLRIPVIIRGRIAGPHSYDDGTSIEFSVLVDHVEMDEPK